ncbi:MAG: SDR family oxidoreductase [Bacteroidales bacterium]|jgi:NAD(P)-dependent dehydrogenase (short-subunit alcohol dehydrogenase family)|nr:SDR family oxidoreductase [Bacteroidales bacterium]
MNIIITGASRGIGRETAKTLAANKNNHILAISRSESLLRKLSGEAEFNNITYMATDINESLKSPESFLKELDEHFSLVDVLINNAGSLVSKPLGDLSYSEIGLMTETNFLSPLLLIKLLSGRFRKGSHIVNISSMGGFQGSSRYPGMSVYNASKAALSNLTESLAYEFEKEKIFFNCLALGAVQTEMLNEAFPGYRAPLRPDEMAEFISWFATEGRKYFNGKVLPVSVSNP